MSNEQKKGKKQQNKANAFVYVPKVDEAVKPKEEEPKPKQRYPSLSFTNGVLQSMRIKYKLKPEGKKAITDFFNTLLPPSKPEQPRLVFTDEVEHGHPVGAIMRAVLSELVYYHYERSTDIYEPAVSKIRLNKLVDHDGTDMTHRVFSSCHKIDIFDLIREKNQGNMDLELRNHCDCKMGDEATVCSKAGDPAYGPTGCVKIWGAIMLTECLYYVKVLEGAVARMGKKSCGYGVFNDYLRSLITVGPKGRACDDESVYEISPDGKVTVNVRQNPFHYHHGIVDTCGSDNWQTHVFDGKENVLVFFQTLKTFLNGDVPAKLVKFITFRPDELREVKQFRIPGVPYAKNFFWTPQPELFFPKEGLSEKFELPPLPEDVNIQKLKTVNISADLAKIVTKVVVVPKDKETLKSENFFKEQDGKMPITKDNQVLDFLARESCMHDCSELLDAIKKQVIGTKLGNYLEMSSERFFVDKDKTSGDNYLTLEVVDKAWFGLNVTKFIHRAKFDLISKAYRKLGTKSLITSIDHCITQVQREMKEEAPLSELADITEAVAIARVIRAQQTVRLKRMLEASTSVSEALKK